MKVGKQQGATQRLGRDGSLHQLQELIVRAVLRGVAKAVLGVHGAHGWRLCGTARGSSEAVGAAPAGTVVGKAGPKKE
jgi:hypothetical protein